MLADAKRSPANVEANAKSSLRSGVDQQVREKIGNCPYAFYFNRVTWRFNGKCLELQGCVPTFYMKQILQTVLRDVDGVACVVNKVDVVSSTSLSTIRAK